MVTACKRAGATTITAITPYYGYARQDRKFMNRAQPISGADVSQILEHVGVDRIATIDVHCDKIIGSVSPRTVFDNFNASVTGISYFLKEIPDKNKICIISPDAGGIARATQFHSCFKYHGYYNVSLAFMSKVRKVVNEVHKVRLIGDVQGKTCIIVDDMIDTAGTLCISAKHLVE